MSKIVYVCYKNPERSASVKEKIAYISKRISPDNITVAETKIVMLNGITYGIFNPVKVVKEQAGSVLLGGVFGDITDWWEPKTIFPDGSYAMFRSNDEFVEVVSDAAGSRSVWYYHDEELFIASTSQRAIVAIIGNFQFNKNVLPWMLSTGSLGPSNSWDSRINLLPPDSAVTLVRNDWTLEIISKKIEFRRQNISDDEQESLLKSVLFDTFKTLNLDYKNWVLPLSGGYDSRGILCLLNQIGLKLTNLTAVTWGLNSSLNQKGNDAFVAKRLAGFFKMPHKYYSTDLTDEPIEDILNRFIVCGEGRVDHIGGYLDGFRIWKNLFEDNVQGILRGDIGFNDKLAISGDHIRSMNGMAPCSKYSNLKDYDTFGLPKQEIPANLTQQEGESLTDYRDRLYQEFRIPVVMAALNDLKLSYVEILNPLLSKKILDQNRKMSDHLRSDKSLWKKIVNSISPAIEYANEGANAKVKGILQSSAFVVILRKELTSNCASTVFPAEFIRNILGNLKQEDKDTKRSRGMKQRLAKYIPIWLLRNKALLGAPEAKVDYNVLAFRMYLAIKMNQFLSEDGSISHFYEECSSRTSSIH